MKHFIGIDYLKGFLLVLVFTGHLLPGTTSENFTRYVIYSFHMPLFIGISGFLLTSERLASYSLYQLANRYFRRMLLPWLVAGVVYYPVNNYPVLVQGSIPWEETLKNVLYPWYHLWFVPVLFLMIVFTWMLERQPHPRRGVILLGALFFSLLWQLLYSGETQFEKSMPFFLLGDKRLYTFFVFFYLGYYLRNSWFARDVSPVVCLASVVGMGLVSVAGFWVSLPPEIATLTFVGLNAALIIFSVRFLANARFWGERFFVFVGVESLPIYLWHIMPLLVMRQLSIDVRYPYIYYPLSVVLFVSLIACVKFMPRLPLTDALIFGLAPSKQMKTVHQHAV